MFASIDLIAVGILTTCFAVVALVVHLDLRQHRRLLQEIAAILDARLEKQCAAGVQDGVRFEAHFLRKGRGSSILKVAMAAQIPGDLLIVRRDGFERLANAAGLVPLAQIGDEQFDQRFAVSSGYPGLAERFLENKATRACVSALFDLGIHTLALSGKAQSIMMVWDPSADFFEQPREPLRHATKLLVRVRAAVPKLTFNPRFADDLHTSGAFAVLIMLALSMIGFGGFAAMAGDVHYEPIDRRGLFAAAAAFAMPLFFLFLHLARKWLRGHLNANQHFIGLAFASVLAFPVTAYAVAVIANGALDDSPPVSKTYVVLDKRKLPSGGTVDHVLKLADRSRNALIMDLPVRKTTFEQAVPGRSEVTVINRAGRLGFAWRDSDSDILID